MKSRVWVPLVALGLGVCSANTVATVVDQLKSVRGELVREEGRFRLAVQLPTYSRPSGDPVAFLSELVACIDNETPSGVTLGGQYVPLGFLCYMALERHVYHEETDENGDLVSTWPGDFVPSDGWMRLPDAQEAWEAAIETGDYTWR